MKKKVTKEGNEITVDCSISYFITGEFQEGNNFSIKVMRPKGKPPHDIWVTFAEVVLEELTEEASESDNILIKGHFYN